MTDSDMDGGDRAFRRAGATADVVIVNWNSGQQLRECVRSLTESAQAGWVGRVVVVDNGSRDGSAEDLAVVGATLEIVRNSENRGFAAACNQGARAGQADYLLFLNPDTLVNAGSLSSPIAFMDDRRNVDVGICGIQLLDEAGVVSRSCSRFPSLGRFILRMFGLQAILPARLTSQSMIEWDHATSRDVDQVIGAFFMVRRSLFEALGGFDERFFVYFEEVDFSFRARSQGARSHYLVEATAFHRGGGCSDQVRATRLVYSIRSRFAYVAKHFPPWSALAVVVLSLTAEFIARVAANLARGSWDGMRETVDAYRVLWREAPRNGAAAIGRMWRSSEEA